MDQIAPSRKTEDGPSVVLDHIDTWIFDLDNTLYPAACNLFAQIDVRMTAFIAETLDVDPVEARRLQKSYFHEHGTTLNGLMTLHGIAPADFLEYVHDIDLSAVAAAPELEQRLAGLPGCKIVFTNGSQAHAERVLDRLGVGHHFRDIFDIHAAAYVPKPSAETYAGLISRFSVDPARAIMFDDLSRNLLPAHRLGMTTVWVDTASEWSRAPEPDDSSHIDYVCDDLLGFLRRIAP
jgi:putative hydrolase of the HAD superfamily